MFIPIPGERTHRWFNLDNVKSIYISDRQPEGKKVEVYFSGDGWYEMVLSDDDAARLEEILTRHQIGEVR